MTISRIIALRPAKAPLSAQAVSYAFMQLVLGKNFLFIPRIHVYYLSTYKLTWHPYLDVLLLE